MLGPAGQGQRKPTSPLSPEAVGRQEWLIRQEAQREVVEARQWSRGLLHDPEDRPLQGESGRDWGGGGIRITAPPALDMALERAVEGLAPGWPRSTEAWMYKGRGLPGGGVGIW